MRSDFRLIFVQLARLGPTSFEDVLCRHYTMAADLFVDLNDSSYFEEVVQRSTSEDWGLDASGVAGWENVENHSELMAGLSVVFNLVDGCVDEDLGYDFLADFLADIGSEHYESGDFPRSLECFEMALRYAEQCGNVTGVADVHERIGDANLQRHDHAGAFSSFQQAILNREAILDFRGVARCLMKIAEVLERYGQKTDAIEFLTVAIQVLTKHGGPIDVAPAHEALARIYTTNRPTQTSPSRRLPCHEIRLNDLMLRADSSDPAPSEFHGPMIKRLEQRVANLRSLLNQAKANLKDDAELD